MFVCLSYRKVFTNPARFDENGRLCIEYYHEQNECQLSAKNLCKGHVLEDYIQQRINENNNDNHYYNRLHYVGDGSNDLCPSLRLSSNDFVYPRSGYKLDHLIREKLEQQQQQQQQSEQLKACSIPFCHGDDIWNNILNANRN